MSAARSAAWRDEVTARDELATAFGEARDAYDRDPTRATRDAMYAAARTMLTVGERPVLYTKDAAGRLVPIILAIVTAFLLAACGGSVASIDAGVLDAGVLDAGADVARLDSSTPDTGPDVVLQVDAHEASAPDVVLQVDAAPDVHEASAPHAGIDAPILIGCPVACEGGTYRVSCNCGVCGCPALGEDGGS